MTRNRSLVLAAALLLTVGITSVRAASTDDREALRKALASAIRQGRSPAMELPPEPGPALRKWLKDNAAAYEDVHPGGLGEQPWGLSALRPGGRGKPSLMYLYVFDWHASGKLTVYGLTGGVARAYLLAEPAQTALPVTKIGHSLVYTVPKDPPDPLATIVVLDLNDKLATMALVTSPDDGGRITLHARDAIIHGRTVRYEPEPHKNTVGYWTDPRDWVHWQFEATKPGTYAADIVQGCGKGSGGSTVDFSVEKQVLKVTVKDTGGFQNFITRRIGQFQFDKPGRYTLAVKPTHKPGVAVMDLRSVTLTPVEKSPVEK
jgi:hypothetical protein